MSLTRTQKRWAIGGGIGATAICLGYELWWKKRGHRGHAVHHEKRRGHHHHEEPGTDLAVDESYERGEYGKKHGRHRHKDHHGEQ